MKIEITDAPRKEDEAFVIDQIWKYNSSFAENDHKSLCVFARDQEDHIIGALTGRTYWEYLEVAFLWVDERFRSNGYATELMKAAEDEARERGCTRAFLNTFSFQSLRFYQKLGYVEFGRLFGFSGKYERHYLYKRLDSTKSMFPDDKIWSLT